MGIGSCTRERGDLRLGQGSGGGCEHDQVGTDNVYNLMPGIIWFLCLAQSWRKTPPRGGHT